MFTFRFSLILLFLFQIGKAGAQSPSNRLDVVQIEKYLQKSYQEYMEAINTDDRETEEKFLKNMLTPEMQEKRARLACATDSDPMGARRYGIFHPVRTVQAPVRLLVRSVIPPVSQRFDNLYPITYHGRFLGKSTYFVRNA